MNIEYTSCVIKRIYNKFNGLFYYIMITLVALISKHINPIYY
jgi:hypothetical protein